MALPKDALKGWAVVVVDDEPDSLNVVRLLLEMHGATVIGGGNGHEGLELIEQHVPNFVISDLAMPDMSGWEMIKALKSHQNRQIANIPVIALTAHAMDQHRRRAIEVGFHNFITKPLEPEKFVKQVIELLAVDMPELRSYIDTI